MTRALGTGRRPRGSRLGLWVVEALWTDAPRRWHTTVGCRLTRSEGRHALRYWRQRNPHDTFRLRRYWSER